MIILLNNYYSNTFIMLYQHISSLSCHIYMYMKYESVLGVFVNNKYHFNIYNIWSFQINSIDVLTNTISKALFSIIFIKSFIYMYLWYNIKFKVKLFWFQNHWINIYKIMGVLEIYWKILILECAHWQIISIHFNFHIIFGFIIYRCYNET